MAYPVRGHYPEEDITDAELVARALAGSEEAYRQLVLRFERPVMTVILRLVRDRQLAEDLAQESFVKAFRHLARYDSRRKLASWLFKIAHNTTLDYLRKFRPVTVPLEASSGDDPADSWEVLRAPEDQKPDRRADSAALRQALDRALGKLRPSYSEVLTLRFQEGLSYQEIAEVTGLALGTVKIHLHRGRKALAQRLAEAGWAPPGRWGVD